MLNKDPVLAPPDTPRPSPTKVRWLFCCTNCFTPVLMPAVPQNLEGQLFYCGVCLEHQWFMRVTASLGLSGSDMIFTLHF